MGRLTCSARSLIRFFFVFVVGGNAKTHSHQSDNSQTLTHLLRMLKNSILLRSRRPGPDCSQRLRTKGSKQGTDSALCPPPCPLQGLDFDTSHQFRPTPATRGPLDRRSQTKLSQVKSGVRHHFVNENGHSLESTEGMAIVLMPLSSLRQPGSPHNSLDSQALRPPVTRGLPFSRIPFPDFVIDLSPCGL